MAPKRTHSQGSTTPLPPVHVEEPAQTRGTTDPPALQWAVATPVTVAMPQEQQEQAVHAWAVLIASWWTDNPPDDQRL